MPNHVNPMKLLKYIKKRLDLFRSSLRQVFPDSERTLRSCTDMGLKLGVVSNFDNRLEGILRACGLLSHFSFLVTSEGAKVAKPDAAIFHQALQRCGDPASSVAHVGDHYVNDYLTARSLGLLGLLLDREGSTLHLDDVPARHRLSSLDELPALLQKRAEGG